MPTSTEMLVANILVEDRTGQAPLQEIYRSFPVLAHADQLYGPLLSVPYYSADGTPLAELAVQMFSMIGRPTAAVPAAESVSEETQVVLNLQVRVCVCAW